jgi:hypothetical protein
MLIRRPVVNAGSVVVIGLISLWRSVPVDSCMPEENSHRPISMRRVSTCVSRRARVDWVAAVLLADFYYRRFEPQLRPAVPAWRATRPFMNPDAPLPPLSTRPSTGRRRLPEADRRSAKGDAKARVAQGFVALADKCGCVGGDVPGRRPALAAPLAPRWSSGVQVVVRGSGRPRRLRR